MRIIPSKKSAYLLIAVFSILLIQSSCIKRDLVSQTNDYLQSTIKAWMQGQKIENPTSNAFIDSLDHLANWRNLTVLSINNMEDLVYVPVNYNSHKTGLTFIVNNRNRLVETGYLSEISTTVLTQNGENLKSVSQISPAELIMANFYRYRLNDFTGSIVAYAITNKFLWEMGYASGTHRYKKNIVGFGSNYKPPVYFVNDVLQKSPFENVTKNLTSGCFAYYMVTYWEDLEASVSTNYLGQVCDQQCEITQVISQDKIPLNRAICGSVKTIHFE